MHSHFQSSVAMQSIAALRFSYKKQAKENIFDCLGFHGI
jgi:hypothetical protein